jgi:DNA primase catalytic subunit
MKTQTQNTAKTNWKNSFRASRKAASRDVKNFVRSIRPQTEIALAKLSTLAREVAREVAPKLAELREVDNFIHSGRSLVAFANNRGKA